VAIILEDELSLLGTWKRGKSNSFSLSLKTDARFGRGRCDGILA
jgi:hypothetical protein